MCVCSAITSDSNPRSSIARASDTGSMPSSVTKVEIPNFIRAPVGWLGRRNPTSGRRYSPSQSILLDRVREARVGDVGRARVVGDDVVETAEVDGVGGI